MWFAEKGRQIVSKWNLNSPIPWSLDYWSPILCTWLSLYRCTSCESLHYILKRNFVSFISSGGQGTNQFKELIQPKRFVLTSALVALFVQPPVTKQCWIQLHVHTDFSNRNILEQNGIADSHLPRRCFTFSLLYLNFYDQLSEIIFLVVFAFSSKPVCAYDTRPKCITGS